MKPADGSPTVTAAASAERVRFSAPNAVAQLRLEVYSPDGEKIFDTELRGGSVVDWLLQDGAGPNARRTRQLGAGHRSALSRIVRNE